MIDKLTDAECEITECVARRLNVVIEAVEALRRQFERHEAAEDGADPADDEADPVEGDTLDLDAIESRAHRLMVATWECDKHSHNDQWQMVRCDVPALVAAVRSLRAERDAAQARVAELEADIAALREHSWGDLPGYGACDPLTRRIHDADAALGALVRRMQRRVIVERLRDGTYSVGLRGEPRVYFRDEERTFAWAADAALGEE